MTTAELLKANPLPEGLTPYGLMALEHWAKHLPQYCRELEARGTLLQELIQADQATQKEMQEEEERLIQSGEAPTVAHQMAWEVIRTRHLFLPAESSLSATPS